MEERIYLLKNPEDGSVIAQIVFYSKKCSICSKVFESKIKRTLYCSDICRFTANKKKALNDGNKSQKFQKNNKCQYCEEKMDAKYRSKRFCSPKCRVYFGRENKRKVKNEVIITPPVASKPKESFFDKMRNKKLGI